MAAKAVGKGSKAKPKRLADFVKETLGAGQESYVPIPISGLLGVADDAPAFYVYISSDQASDGMSHIFTVLVVSSAPSATPDMPSGLVLDTTYEWPGNSEGYSYRSTLDGTLEKAIVISGKRDEQGRSIKGAGSSAEKDISSADIKDRFKHELDLWLKKSYLKKEWKSAKFVEGELKKE